MQQTAMLSGKDAAAAALRGGAGNFSGIVAARLQAQDAHAEEEARTVKRQLSRSPTKVRCPQPRDTAVHVLAATEWALCNTFRVAERQILSTC